MLPPDEEVEKEAHPKDGARIEGGSQESSLLPVRALQSLVQTRGMVACRSAGGEEGGREGGRREGGREGGRREGGRRERGREGGREGGREEGREGGREEGGRWEGIQWN